MDYNRTNQILEHYSRGKINSVFANMFFLVSSKVSFVDSCGSANVRFVQQANSVDTDLELDVCNSITGGNRVLALSTTNKALGSAWSPSQRAQ
jgi:hypothetical protein